MKPPPSLAAYAKDTRGVKAADTDLVKYRGLRGVLARLLFFIPEAGPGLRVTMTNEGPIWSINQAANDATWHNFQPYNITPTSCQISDGIVSVFGDDPRRPTINGTALNAATPPTLGLSASGINYIYIVLELVVVTSSGYVLRNTIATPKADRCFIEAYTGEQTSTDTVRYLPLCQIKEGAVLTTTQRSNISLRAFDNGTATSKPLYTTW